VCVSVIVVDDGSTEAPVDVDALHDERVRMLRDDWPAGVATARNRGLAHVTAPWVAFLDDDDVWAPDYLSTALDAIAASRLDRGRVGLVYSGHLDLDSRHEVTAVSRAAPAASIRAGLERMNLVGCPSRVLLSTTAVRTAGGFDPRFSILADWDLWVRVVARYEVVRNDELLVGYTHHAANMHRNAEGLIAEFRLLRQKYGWGPAKSRDAVFGDLLPAYVAAAHRANGQRLRAARWYVRSYRSRGAPRDLGRAVGALLGERVVRFSRLGRRPTVDPALGRWLDAVHAVDRTAPTGRATFAGPRRDSRVP
jgi:glycosyltransferase involved in cell wall biosynthesis